MREIGRSVALLFIGAFRCSLVYLVALVRPEAAAERRILRSVGPATE